MPVGALARARGRAQPEKTTTAEKTRKQTCTDRNVNLLGEDLLTGQWTRVGAHA